jgi:ABC-type Fe3+-hydroxamate transport system substrate-binding protein
MRTQKYVLSFLTIALLILTIVGCEKAQKAEEAVVEETTEQAQKAEKPSVERTTEHTFSATVEAVDMEERSVTLKDEEGVTHTFANIKADVPLEKLEVGKTVSMTIYQKEINYAVEEGEEIPGDEKIRAVGTKEGEEERRITIVQSQTMTTTVKEVDTVNRMLTLVMEDGMLITLPVQDDVKNLENLEPGDKVVSLVTQLIMLTLEE